MLTIFLNILYEAYRIFADSSPYLVFGFLIAGLLHAYFPRKKIQQFFGRSNAGSVVNASLFGIPLPLCSCSVIPTAVAMRKAGASRGAVFSFLVSTPETSVPSIGISFAILDPMMTIFRPLSAFVTSILIGFGINVFGQEKEGDKDIVKPIEEHDVNGKSKERLEKLTKEAPPESHYKRVWNALDYGFFHLLDDMAPWLVIGFLASGVISVIIPASFFAGFWGSGFQAMLLMLVIGIPLYICATESTPIAAALILKGLSPGAAFVFLLVGPATNVGSLIILSKYFPKRVIALYLGGLAVISLMLGGLLNFLYSYLNLNIAASLGSGASALPEWIKISSVLLLAGLMHRSLFKGKQYAKTWQWLQKRTGTGSRKLAWIVVVVLIIIYIADGFFIVPAGNTGMSLTFGNVTKADLPPGLYYRPPTPFGRSVIVETDLVRSLEMGFRRTDDGQITLMPVDAPLVSIGEKLDPRPQVDRPEESEYLAGDENLIDIDVTLHYSITDAYQATYRIDDIEMLLRQLLAHHVLLDVTMREVADELTAERGAFEHYVKADLVASLQELGIGVRLHSVNLVYGHAPDVVHSAFRDVSSALEDKYRLINLAQADSVTKVAEARAKVGKKLAQARSDSARQVSDATGESSRFTAIASATRNWRSYQQFRMNAEAAETTLVNINKILVLTEHGQDLDLFLLPPSNGLPNNLPPEIYQRLQQSVGQP
ncbi:MAG: SO_0444 family Cu/Zn efflux transporter [bacterium]